MIYKKCMVLVSLLAASTGVAAQQCESTVGTVIAGSRLGTLIQMTNSNCGISGFVCAETSGEFTQSISNRVYAAALTAQATDANVTVSWDNSTLLCDGRFPLIVDFRVNAE